MAVRRELPRLYVDGRRMLLHDGHAERSELPVDAGRMPVRELLPQLIEWRGKLELLDDPKSPTFLPRRYLSRSRTGQLWVRGLGLLTIVFTDIDVSLANCPPDDEAQPREHQRLRVLIDWVSSGAPLMLPAGVDPDQVAAWEASPDLFAYHDWCLDHGWETQAAAIAERMRLQTASVAFPEES